MNKQTYKYIIKIQSTKKLNLFSTLNISFYSAPVYCVKLQIYNGRCKTFLSLHCLEDLMIIILINKKEKKKEKKKSRKRFNTLLQIKTVNLKTLMRQDKVYSN